MGKNKKRRNPAARALVTVFKALAIALGLLYIGEYFGSSWVREAAGLRWVQ